MAKISALLAVLVVLAGTAPGADDVPAGGKDVHVVLNVGKPAGEAKLGYSKARPLAIETTVPRFLFEVPKFNAKDPLFFRVALGETKGVPFYGALDRSPASDYHDLLHVDKNRDLDLTNDGPPLKGSIRTFWQDNKKLVEFLGVALDVPYTVEGKEARIPYPCVVYFVTAPKGRPLTVQVERDGWREGAVEVAGKQYRFAFIDDDCDGNYTTGDNWTMRAADATTKDLLARDATRSMLFPAWSLDEKWTIEIKKVDLQGTKATLHIKPAKETEREYFLRVALAQQPQEERQLKLDPMRPKADKGDQVKWLKDKDVKYTLGIANSPNVKKRVLLDFTSKNCVWCARMDKYTFRDREVVQLTEKFVCAKVMNTTGDAKKYNVAGTPTYVILDTDGSEISRHEGFLRPTDFAAWLKSALR
jgi:hypothetical protein